MKKITLHHTAGTHTFSDYEKTKYHFGCEGTGRVVAGNYPPEVNRHPLGAHYMQHCGGFNTDNIGVALCGMAGSNERPFRPGDYPITHASYRAGVELCADLCETYRIKPTRQTVFLHSEVKPRWGRGKYKWDVNWVPDLAETGNSVAMGDMFRKDVTNELRRRHIKEPVSLWARFLQKYGRAA